MKVAFVLLAAMLAVAAACPEGYTTVNTHCTDKGNCVADSDCNHGEECCFPDNGGCDSMCSAIHDHGNHGDHGHHNPPAGK